MGKTANTRENPQIFSDILRPRVIRAMAKRGSFSLRPVLKQAPLPDIRQAVDRAFHRGQMIHAGMKDLRHDSHRFKDQFPQAGIDLILSGIERNLAAGVGAGSNGNGHEIRYCRSDRVGRDHVGPRAFERNGCRRQVTAVHCARRIFRRTSVRADR